jgi:hypothetical protein
VKGTAAEVQVNVRTVWLAVMLHIQEIPGLKCGSEEAQQIEVFVCLSIHPGKDCDSTSN